MLFRSHRIGTCVNVGCIPKKLMHQSGIVKESMDNSAPFGWTAGTTTKEVNWYAYKLRPSYLIRRDGLVNSVQNYIKSLNFGYKNDLLSNDVTYLNHLATFQDSETVTTTGKKAGVGVRWKLIICQFSTLENYSCTEFCHRSWRAPYNPLRCRRRGTCDHER